MTSSTRLPTSIVPSSYDVALIPDLKAFTFQGHVSITIKVASATDSITMHSADLTYPGDANAVSIVAMDQPSQVHQATELSLDSKHQRVTFTFSSGVLTVGKSYVLHIRYDGILNDQLCGFYRSQYKSPTGETKYMAVTQFEATDARRALPCWDEPACKATFKVTLIVEKHLTAVSNMPVVIKRTVEDSTAATETPVNRGLTYPAGLIRYEYASTPIMSTYILAFVVGEFDYISAYTKGGVEVRIYTPVGKTHLGYFSLDVAVKAIEFFNRYFGIDYPLPKVDLLAIPDFAAGAMENWGCITYREIALLIDPEHSSAAVKQRCAKTVCHELAHMWFGNLVTMEWWTYLWLNEGFARFMEHVAVNHIFPDWHIWNQFVSDVYSTALALDALESSHPVEVAVNEPEEINEIFDTISYAKGASLIRMLNDTIGDDAFERGVKLYLKRWSWKNTKTEDLWDALSEASGQNIAALMDTWVKRMGYPVLSITEKSTHPRTFHITQQRYLSNGNEEKGSHQHWNVPIIVGVYGKDGKQNVSEKNTVFLKIHSDTITLPSSISSDAIIKFNVSQSGFFRVQYDEKLFQILGNAIEQNLLPPTDRLGIHRDSFALATSGRIPISVALDLLTHFTHETSYPVVSAITSSIGSLVTIHSEQPYYKQLQKFIAHLFRSSYTRFGWEAKPSEDHVTSLFRAAAISMMATADDPDVVKQAIAYVEDEKASIPADLRATVYATASKHGGDKIREILLTRYRKTELAEEKQRILAALGKNVSAVKANLEFAFSNEVRTGDVPYIIASIASSSQANRATTWTYFITNWNVIQERFTKGSSFLIGHLMDSTLSGFLTVAEAEAFESFFKQHPCAPADRTIRQASETVRTRAARLSREKEPLQNWLTQHQF